MVSEKIGYMKSRFKPKIGRMYPKAEVKGRRQVETEA